MAQKRSRKDLEADLQAQQSPYVLYGTPLPPFDPDVRDDGSYVPLWKQEVRDERGRKRLHGAFTGGFSAGYFNSVGSKDGWTPSTFVSSRSNRQQRASQSEQERREQYMDDEDIADAAESLKLHTAQTFSGLGATEDDGKRTAGLIDLFKPQGETMGVKLLRKMGWKDGQGIGPRVRRAADLSDPTVRGSSDSSLHCFAPKDTAIIKFHRKTDRKGLGFEGESRLGASSARTNDSDDDPDTGPLSSAKRQSQEPHAALKLGRGGIGTGVLDDDDGDAGEEDPYAIGPSISYNRIIRGGKKSKKKSQPKVSTSAANPLLGNKPVFRAKKLAPSNGALRKCHDGRLPLAGFLLHDSAEFASSGNGISDTYQLPVIPKDWKSAKGATATHIEAQTYRSPADAAKASQLNPTSRAAILGEATLPGKSIFSFMTPEARARIATATKRSDFPAAEGEAIKLPPRKDPNAPVDLSLVPALVKSTALAALGRGVGGWFPYADDEGKRDRYRAFLEYTAGLRQDLAPRLPSQDADAQLVELQEFAHAAEVFRPMTGAMASRFQSASAAPGSTVHTTEANSRDAGVSLGGSGSKDEDPAEAAARMGMFGPMTRSMGSFAPTRLLCKRFGVPPPDNAVTEQRDGQEERASDPAATGASRENAEAAKKVEALLSSAQVADFARREGTADPATDGLSGGAASSAALARGGIFAPAKVDTEYNEALHGERAGEELFKSIFGDDGDDDDDGGDDDG